MLETTGMSRPIGRAYSIVAVCQALAAAASLLALRWLAAYVSPQAFGRYALYQSVVAAGGLFLVSWPNAALLRFGREEWNRRRRVGVTLAARLFLFGVSAVLAIVMAWMFDTNLRMLLGVDRSPLLWLAAGLIVMPAAEMFIYMNQTVGHTEVYGYSPLVVKCTFLVFIALIPVFGVNPTWQYLAGGIISATALAATMTSLMLPAEAWRGFRVESTALTLLLRYSWSLPLAALSTYVVNWVDSWVIRAFKGIGPVGVYNWAYQATAIAGLAFAPLAVVLTPRVIDARLSRDDERLARYIGAILPAALIVAFAVDGVLAVLFPLLQVAAGPAYRSAYAVIVILLSALPFQVLGYLVTPVANAVERLIPRFVMVGVVVAAVNAIGDLLLIPTIGINGAAISSACAFTVGGLLQVFVVRSAVDGFRPLWRYIAPAVVTAPALCGLLLLGPSIGAAVGVGVIFIGLCVGRFYYPLPVSEIDRLVAAMTLSPVPGSRE